PDRGRAMFARAPSTPFLDVRTESDNGVERRLNHRFRRNEASEPAEIGAERRRDETDLPDKGSAVHGPELEQIERHEICVRRIIDAVNQLPGIAFLAPGEKTELQDVVVSCLEGFPKADRLAGGLAG